MTSQLSSLVEMYGRARATVEASLVAAGKSLARNRQRSLLDPSRLLEPTIVGSRALAAVAVLALGTAILLQLGFLNPFAPYRGAVATHPDEGVFGGAGGPPPSGSAASTPAPGAPGAVIARMDFDELRIGPLAGASDEIGPVVGSPEVAAYPSPFDRSIRVGGDGSHRFCLPITNFVEGPVLFGLDLYATTPTASGRLTLSITPSDVAPTAVSVPLETLGGLRLEAWHHLRAAWTPGQPVAITISDPVGDQAKTVNVPPAHDAQAMAGGVCVEVSGMAADAVLLLDNLRVEQ